MVKNVRRTLFLFFGISLILLSISVRSAVVATIDRPNVELNESFTLKVIVDSSLDLEPDSSNLEKDFHVGTRSQLSNTSIVNGQISRSRTWTYVMMAKREGVLTIPSIRIGSEQSQPIQINVLPASNSLPGEAEIFVTTEVDREESFVQAQILHKVKVYRAVATRQPRLSEPSISGVEVLIEQVGEERTYEAMLDSKAYNVVERSYAIFPQESGKILIDAARFEARVLQNGRITGRKIYESKPIEVNVLPIPDPPIEYPNAVWFPAKLVNLEESWSRDIDDLPIGEPITRHLTITAVGQLSTQLPIIKSIVADSIKIYPDKPEFRDMVDSSGIRAIRRDQYALMATKSGELKLPEINLPWWNIDDGEWQVATIPEKLMLIHPSLQSDLYNFPEEESQKINDQEVQVELIYIDFWRYISITLFIVWLITLITWKQKNRSKTLVRQQSEEPIYKKQSKFLKRARKAALDGDSEKIKDNLMEWSRLEWSHKSPRSIGEIALRVSDPLSSQLKEFCEINYGNSKKILDGKSLAKSLKGIKTKEDFLFHKESSELPPLSPLRNAS